MFGYLGSFTTRLWWLVFVVWGLVALAVQFTAPVWDQVAEDGNADYLPKNMTSVRAQEILDQAFPDANPLLDASDILNPRRFATQFYQQAEEEGPNPASHLWKLLPDSARATMQSYAAGEFVDVQAEDELISDLNELLRKPNFYKEAAFDELEFSPRDRELVQVSQKVSQWEIQVRNRVLLENAFPEQIKPMQRRQANSQLAIIVERPEGELTDADYNAIDALAAEFAVETANEALPIVDRHTYAASIIGSQLISADGQAVLTLLQLPTEFVEVANKEALLEALDRIEKVQQREGFPEYLNIGVSGSAAIGGDTIIASQESIRNTENTTVILVLLMLLIVYRAPLLVLVPITTIVLAAFTAVQMCAILADQPWLDFQVFTTSKIFIVVILFGAGTDFCLFLISRYKENLDAGLPRREALSSALRQVAPAITASATTTMCGLAVLFFAEFGKYHYSGPTIALCLGVALIACLTLAPALLQMVGYIVFWPFTAQAKPKPAQEPTSDPGGDRVWKTLMGFVIARPIVTLLLSVLVLGPWALLGWDSDFSFDMLSELPRDRPSVQGTKMVERHFPEGEIGPVVVVVNHPEKDLESKQAKREMRTLSRMLYNMDGVQDVRSFAKPIGGAYTAFPTASESVALKHPKTRNYYLTPIEELKGDYTRLEVVLASDPFDQISLQLLKDIEAELLALANDSDSYWYGASFDFGGVTASIRDLKAVTSADRALIQPLVVVVVFAILMMLLRHLGICVYLMASVLFSYLVTMGVTEFVFQTWYGDGYDGLDWKVPLYLYVILVAVGMDYNIYLITRVVEEQEQRGPVEGIRWAVIRTGGIITSCGLIMAGTFMSMMTGSMRGLTQLGFALSFGILLDTFIIRTLLVPAFLTILYRRSAVRKTESESDSETADEQYTGPAPHVSQQTSPK